MKKWNVVFIFLGFLSLSMLLTLPASLVLKQIKLDKNLSIGAVQGAWWSFNVDWLNYKGFTQEKIHITFKPSCLITANICFNADNEQAHILFEKSLINDSLMISNSFFNIGLDEINPLLKNMLVKPKGSLEIQIESLAISEQSLIALTGDVYWHSVGVDGEAFDLGTIQAKLKHEPKQIRISLDDQSDKLDLSGTIIISNNGLIDSQVQLKTLANFPSTVKSVLQNVMKKRGNDVLEYKAKVSNSTLKSLNLAL